MKEICSVEDREEKDSSELNEEISCARLILANVPRATINVEINDKWNLILGQELVRLVILYGRK